MRISLERGENQTRIRSHRIILLSPEHIFNVILKVSSGEDSQNLDTMCNNRTLTQIVTHKI
jgi:hypothetical protein